MKIRPTTLRGALLRIVLLLVLAALCWQLSVLARIWWWRDHPPSSTAFMEVRAEQRASDGRGPLAPHPWVPYARIPATLKRAVVASEDARFLEHEGFDWDGMEHALRKDIRSGRLVAGGSTITQQLAKNLFLSERRTLPRKLEEALITLMLERMWGKRRILEVYLNVIEWGDGVFGCEAAARHYFHGGVDRLAPEQAARLAAMIPSPRFFDRHPGSHALARRTATVMARLSSAAVP